MPSIRNVVITTKSAEVVPLWDTTSHNVKLSRAIATIVRVIMMHETRSVSARKGKNC